MGQFGANGAGCAGGRDDDKGVSQIRRGAGTSREKMCRDLSRQRFGTGEKNGRIQGTGSLVETDRLDEGGGCHSKKRRMILKFEVGMAEVY